MRARIFIAAAALALAGCQATPEKRPDDGQKLSSSPNSQQRMDECSQSYRPSSKEFAECWSGARPTRKELCDKGGAFLNHQWASDWQKMAVYEKMRNNGCMN